MATSRDCPDFLEKRPVAIISLLLVFSLILSTLSACRGSFSSPTGKTKLVVFEAGSLMVPMAQVEKEFETANPDIDVEIQAHGSIQVIRHVTELGEDVDVVAVADYSLIPMLMYRTMTPEGKSFADWYIKPATNQLVLAYAGNSKYAEELNTDNWYQILSRSDVRVGLADPRMDAVGYRTLMVTKLAESYYGVAGIMDQTYGSYFSIPIEAVESNGVHLITVPELLEPNAEKMYLRGASMQLIALLQSGDIDYAFEYKSVVAQQGLKYLELPSEINLGDDKFADNYRKVHVKIDFRRFKSIVPEFDGLPIAYGLTIAANSDKKEAAARFLAFILGPDGQRIFNENHHPPLLPSECDNPNALPERLKVFFP
jgi:molybdate/tungstate transport system substrate-binding protein